MRGASEHPRRFKREEDSRLFTFDTEEPGALIFKDEAGLFVRNSMQEVMRRELPEGARAKVRHPRCRRDGGGELIRALPEFGEGEALHAVFRNGGATQPCLVAGSTLSGAPLSGMLTDSKRRE